MTDKPGSNGFALRGIVNAVPDSSETHVITTSAKVLAKNLGMPPKQIRTYLKELEDKKLIRIEPLQFEKGMMRIHFLQEILVGFSDEA